MQRKQHTKPEAGHITSASPSACTWRKQRHGADGVKEVKDRRGLPGRLDNLHDSCSRLLNITHCHIVCLAIALHVELVRPAEPVPLLLCVCIGPSAATVLLLPLICRLADLEDLALAAEHVLAAFALVERFA
jgi:hypothetical protein